MSHNDASPTKNPWCQCNNIFLIKISGSLELRKREQKAMEVDLFNENEKGKKG